MRDIEIFIKNFIFRIKNLSGLNDWAWAICVVLNFWGLVGGILSGNVFNSFLSGFFLFLMLRPLFP